MGFRQPLDIQFRIRTIRINACIQINIMGAGQFTVHFYAVVAGNPVIHAGSQHAFQTTGIGFRRHIHLNLVTAAEGNIVTGLKFAFLVQRHIRIDGNLIRRCNKAVAVHPHVFANAAALAFHLVGHVHIGIGVVHLAFFSVHSGIFTNNHIGSGFNILTGLYIRRKLDHAADIHMVVPVLVVIGAGDNFIACQHIALPCFQLSAFHNLRFGIHLHVVIGVGPGHA